MISRVAREAIAVVAASFAIAVAMTWPALRSPMTTIPHDLVDSALMGWEVRWGAHALLTDPVNLFNANAFYPDRLSYAFSDTLLGYWPLGLLGDGHRGAILAINLIYVTLFAVATIGGYALARQLGANRLGSAVAGLALAYAPWRLAQVSHLHVISTGGMALALAMLARGHGWSIRYGLRPERGSLGWIIGGWLVAAWQITIGFGIGLVWVYVLAAICVTVVVLWWRRGRRPVSRAVVLANLAGGTVFAAVSLLMAVPYLQVIEDHPYARRSIAELGYYSPPLHSFLIGPGESLLWHEDPLRLRETVYLTGEMTLLPGFALLALATVGVWISAWPRRWRIGLGIGALASMILATGTRTLFGGRLTYLVLYQLPGWNGIRTPGRLVVWTTLLLALLAAGAVTALTQRVRDAAATAPQPSWVPARMTGVLDRLRPFAGSALGVFASVLVLVEGLSVVNHLRVPDPPAALTAQYEQTVRPPLLVLPSDARFDPLLMLWTTDRFPQMVNGLSGFTTVAQSEIRNGTHSFPDETSIALLREYGVRTVVVLRDRIPGTPWADAADRPAEGLGVTRTEIDDAVVFNLD